MACTWDESTAGRSANDITSTFQKVILHYSKMKKITFWMDNCAAQNKNWNLFLHLILLVNCKEVEVQEITLKYFETGHTFMAADSYHAAVEKKMKTKAPVTIDDFKDVLECAEKNVTVFQMHHQDFFETRLQISQYALKNIHPRPYMDKMKQVVIQKGSYALKYGDSLNMGAVLDSVMLFTKKQLKVVSSTGFDLFQDLHFKQLPRGIELKRKTALLKVILPVIEEDKKEYWKTLAEKETSDTDEDK